MLRLYAGETPALQFFTRSAVTGETPVPRWLRGMAVPAMIQTLTDL